MKVENEDGNFFLSLVIKVKDDVFLSGTQAYSDLIKEKSECSQQESNQ